MKAEQRFGYSNNSCFIEPGPFRAWLFFCCCAILKEDAAPYHKLCDALTMVMGAVVCGITELSELMVYFESREDIGEAIAVDGKAVRGTGKKGRAHFFLQIVTVYAAESGMTLGQESISHEDKTNEIPVFQSLLDYLDIRGKTITADAMHCQKETCRKIRKKGGDYVFRLKGNQSGLLSENGHKTLNAFW